MAVPRWRITLAPGIYFTTETRHALRLKPDHPMGVGHMCAGDQFDHLPQAPLGLWRGDTIRARHRIATQPGVLRDFLQCCAKRPRQKARRDNTVFRDSLILHHHTKFAA